MKITKDKWNVYNSLNTGFAFQRFWSLVTDKNGHLWTGEGWDNENQCLNRFNGSVWETINPRNEKNEVVKGTVRILQSDGNKIYVVTEQIKNSAFYLKKFMVLYTDCLQNNESISCTTYTETHPNTTKSTV